MSRVPGGLCDRCAHQKLVHTTRGSTFSMCLRHRTEPERYPKYPRLDEVLYFLAENLSKRDRNDPDALKAYRALIERFPKSRFIPDAWMAVGEYWFDKSTGKDRAANLKKALGAYRKAAEYQESSVYGYALYKQGSEGDVSGDKPGFFDFVGTAKFEAWTRLKGMPRDTDTGVRHAWFERRPNRPADGASSPQQNRTADDHEENPQLDGSGQHGGSASEECHGTQHLPDCNIPQYIEERLEHGSTDLYAEVVKHVERYLLTRGLQFAGGNQSKAASILGITRGSLRHKLRALGIPAGRVIEADTDEEMTR